MAKELPYFKFEPAEWMFGRIQKRSCEVRANFIDLCCKYWHKLGQITINEAELDYGKDIIHELLEFQIIESDGDQIKIKFLDNQFEEISQFSDTQRNKGIKSAEKRKKNGSTTVQPLLNDGSTADQPTIEDKIRRDKIRRDKIIIKNNNNDDVAGFDFPKPLDEIVPDYLAQKIAIETVAKNCRMSVEDVEYSVIVFKDQLLAKGMNTKSLKDFTTHFYNWLLKVPVKPKKPNSQQKKKIEIFDGKKP